MSLEPFTKNVRAKLNEKTRGQEYVALASLAASVCIIAFLGKVTERAIFLACAAPLFAFAWLAYRTAGIYSELHLPHRRQRYMIAAVILLILAVGVLVAQELYVKAKGVV